MGSGASRRRSMRYKISPNAKSTEIDEMIQKERAEIKNTVKLLLLGTAGSGKSTILKQMHILHMSGFSELYRGQCRALIYSNIVMGMNQLIDACQQYKLNMNAENGLKDLMNEFVQFLSTNQHCYSYDHQLNPGIGRIISKIWQSKTFQMCYALRHKFELLDSAKYYLDQVKQISEPHYVPTELDILHSRIATTGVVHVEFPYKELTLKMVDVGGHRSEMKKWIHCFDDVKAVLFIVAISEYALMSDEEDPPENRLLRSRRIFQKLTQQRSLSNTSFIIFFNKVDILENVLRNVPLTVCFPEYKGGKDAQRAQLFICDRFSEMVTNNDTIYTHFTIATDTKLVHKVFETCMDIVISANMKTSGLS